MKEWIFELPSGIVIHHPYMPPYKMARQFMNIVAIEKKAQEVRFKRDNPPPDNNHPWIFKRGKWMCLDKSCTTPNLKEEQAKDDQATN